MQKPFSPFTLKVPHFLFEQMSCQLRRSIFLKLNCERRIQQRTSCRSIFLISKRNKKKRGEFIILDVSTLLSIKNKTIILNSFHPSQLVYYNFHTNHFYSNLFRFFAGNNYRQNRGNRHQRTFTR